MTQQTQQEIVDRDLRMILGDLQVQLVFARARIAELEAQLNAMAPQPGEPLKTNLNGATEAARQSG